jgi:basic membrane protein A
VKMRKVLALSLILVMALTLLVGCGQKPETPSEPETPVEQGPEEEPAKKVKVGLVYDVGGRGDLSFNDSAYEGLKRAEKDFDLDIIDQEPSGGGEDREQLLRLLAEDGYDVIIGVGFMFTDHIAKVAEEFPEIKFGLIDGAVDGIDESSNISCLLFKEHEGSFLAGAAAALKSETGKVGFVGGMKSPLIERFEFGYLAGAKFINPDIETYSDYVGTTGEAFNDPVKGKELTLKQIKAGADVVYHASGASGIGVIEAAASEKKLAIGVDSDQSLTATDDQKPYILTSMIKRVDISVYETIKDFVEGKFQGGYRVFGLEDDGVGYASNEFNKDMISDIQPKLEELKAKIAKGEIQAPADKAEYDEFVKGLK